MNRTPQSQSCGNKNDADRGSLNLEAYFGFLQVIPNIK
jgi:hypothetical protein